VPRTVVLHRMETTDCLDSRLFWAMILWSWCGPDVSELVSLKDERGFLRKDRNGKPIPATQNDLRKLLGLAPGMKGAISRAVERLAENGSIRFGDSLRGGGKIIYPERSPTTPEQPSKVANTSNLSRWNLAGVVVHIGDLPVDEVARTAAISWLNDVSTRWRTGLKVLKTSIKEEAVLGFAEHGIIIDKKLKSLREEPSRGRASQILGIVARAPSPSDPPARPQDATPDERQDLKTRLRAHLHSLPIPGKLQEADFERIAASITDERTFSLFKENTKGRDFRKWTLVLTVAKETRERAENYPAEEGLVAGDEALPKWARGLEHEREQQHRRPEE